MKRTSWKKNVPLGGTVVTDTAYKENFPRLLSRKADIVMWLQNNKTAVDLELTNINTM
jgi:hypothetical protein